MLSNSETPLNFYYENKHIIFVFLCILLKTKAKIAKFLSKTSIDFFNKMFKNNIAPIFERKFLL